jgi:hypothetical protein
VGKALKAALRPVTPVSSSHLQGDHFFCFETCGCLGRGSLRKPPPSDVQTPLRPSSRNPRWVCGILYSTMRIEAIGCYKLCPLLYCTVLQPSSHAPESLDSRGGFVSPSWDYRSQ